MLLALLLSLAVADPTGAPPSEEEVSTGPAECMLLYSDVNATVHVAGVTTPIPANVSLPQGEHQARITTSAGQLVVKRIEVKPPTGHTQVIDLSKAPAAMVQGHTFRFEVKGGAEGRIVFVDGVEGGPPPLEVLLSPGPHVVELQAPDGTRSGGEMTLTPQGAGPTVVSLSP